MFKMNNLVNGEDGNITSWCHDVSTAFLPGDTSLLYMQSTHKLHIVLIHHLITLPSPFKAVLSQFLLNGTSALAHLYTLEPP